MQSIQTLAAAADTLVQLQRHNESKSCDSNEVKVSPVQSKRKAVAKISKPKRNSMQNVDVMDTNSLAGTDTSTCSLHSVQIFECEGEFLDKNIKISPKYSKNIELARVVNKMCHCINTSNLDDLTALLDAAAPNCPINIGVAPYKCKHNLRDYFINLANTHPDVVLVPESVLLVESNVISAIVVFSGTRTQAITREYLQRCLGNKSLVDCMNLSLKTDEEIVALRKIEESLYQEGRGAYKTVIGELTLFLTPDVCDDDDDDDELIRDAQQDYLETCSNVSTLSSGSLNEIETSGFYTRKIINASCKWTVINFTLV